MIRIKPCIFAIMACFWILVLNYCSQNIFWSKNCQWDKKQFHNTEWMGTAHTPSSLIHIDILFSGEIIFITHPLSLRRIMRSRQAKGQQINRNTLSNQIHSVTIQLVVSNCYKSFHIKTRCWCWRCVCVMVLAVRGVNVSPLSHWNGFEFGALLNTQS